MYHEFILQSEVSADLSRLFVESNVVEIHDQFILDNIDVFKAIRLYWNQIGNLEYGFCYYGFTIITPEMSSLLLKRIEEYLRGNKTEKAEFFKGKELNDLMLLLDGSINQRKYIIHRGI